MENLNCYWAEYCGSDCFELEDCPDYTPVYEDCPDYTPVYEDEDAADLAAYNYTLFVRYKAYESIIADFE
jgi:hypothetical protein